MGKNFSASTLAVPNASATPTIVSFDADPTVTGVAAAIGSLGLRTDTGNIYVKTTGDDKGWTVLPPGTAALAAIAFSGSANDLVSGTVPAARMPALTGDVTNTVGTVATTIANNAVTDAKLRPRAATSVIGRSESSSGAPDDIAATADGQVLLRSKGSLAFGSLPSTNFGYFGDGSDGDLTLGPGTTPLPQDRYYNNLTVPSGSTLATAGFVICVKGTLTLNGTVDRSGTKGGDAVAADPTNPAIGPGVGGEGTLGGSLQTVSSAGGNGGTGVPSPSNIIDPTYLSNTARGGKGGDGFNPGAFGGNLTQQWPLTAGNFRQLPWCLQAKSSPGGRLANTATGGGGGGGAQSTKQAYGGGGGGGGGYIVLCANTITGSGVVRAKGGDGGKAFQEPGGTKAGGGGGGGGGVVVVVTTSSFPTVDVSGGLGGDGVGVGTGTKGTDGGAGLALLFSA